MKSMVKTLAIALVLTLSLSLLAGCGILGGREKTDPFSVGAEKIIEAITKEDKSGEEIEEESTPEPREQPQTEDDKEDKEAAASKAEREPANDYDWVGCWIYEDYDLLLHVKDDGTCDVYSYGLLEDTLDWNVTGDGADLVYSDGDVFYSYTAVDEVTICDSEGDYVSRGEDDLYTIRTIAAEDGASTGFVGFWLYDEYNYGLAVYDDGSWYLIGPGDTYAEGFFWVFDDHISLYSWYGEYTLWLDIIDEDTIADEDGDRLSRSTEDALLEVYNMDPDEYDDFDIDDEYDAGEIDMTGGEEYPLEDYLGTWSYDDYWIDVTFLENGGWKYEPSSGDAVTGIYEYRGTHIETFASADEVFYNYKLIDADTLVDDDGDTLSRAD